MTAPIPRPSPSEFAPYYAGYIGQIPDRADPLQMLSAQFDSVPAVLIGVPKERERFRYALEKWSIKEVVGHLCDTERIFAYRMLRIARGDATPLASFDENAYVPTGGFDARTLADLTADWVSARRSTIALARGLAPEVWALRGTASGQTVSARALLYIIVGHVEHHLGVLRERYGLGK